MMFESSQYDPATTFAAGGGVGFVSSQLADPSPASAKSRDNQPMYPATVKQIVEATPSTDDKSIFLIDGVGVYNVKLVGMVFNKSERVTDVSFTIDDGTGRIGCNRWVNDPQDTKEVEGLMDGIYVRIHGHLKSSQGKKQVVVYAIKLVSDYNEISNHFIECVHAHCCNYRLQNNGSAFPSAPSSVTVPSGYQAGSSSQISEEYNLDGLGSIDKMVLDHLQLPSSLEAMESLESEGLVYSTIDEFHYKSTAS
ncbi:replication protein a 32 kDa subunit a [Phtheirospermum japonicum]|uniref:Replication protein a 32 kDa subunit a n=1 Tax=Phtheirospermum japonicum TaxID=374723 RepID=A0A830DIQ0_9LAMI|nr:replication protein a 32 kDa subunit a [Phtheirospermum japonicum]